MDVKELTSINNDIVKHAVKLQLKKYRDDSGLFLLEGEKSIQEAIAFGIDIKELFINAKSKNLLSELQKKVKIDVQIYLTSDAVLKKISSTDSAPDIVAVSVQKKFALKDIKSAKRVLLIEDIKDLGNLGTILRSAKAFSQEAIVLYGDTADIYNPKCVRASVGNLWKIPIVQIKEFDELKNFFSGYEIVATLPKNQDTIKLKDYKANSPYLIMFGSEANGLSSELINFATKKVTIEMSEQVESLNLGVSVGIVLYSVS